MWRPTFNKFLLFARKLGGFALLVILLVHAQNDEDQSGFISIDCGLADISSYTDSGSGINFISDAGFIDTGERRTVLYTDGWPQIRYKFVRSFPQGKRNCYRIKVTSGTKYLIRASFLYGNYDGQNKIPEFQLHLGPNLWDTVRLVYDVSNPTRMELIHYVPVVQNYIHVCLVNTSSGVPFISVLELRPLPNSTYSEQKNNSLALVRRGDTGGNGFIIRYPYDKLDRFWYDYSRTDWSQLNTSAEMIGSDYGSQPPSIIMKRAATPKNRTGSLDINLKDIFLEDNAKYHNYYHFAEVEKLPPNQSRLQYIYKDGELIHEPFALSYLETTTIYWRWSLTPNTTLSISKVDNSTLPPILNALEIYLEKEFSASETNQQDVDAITDIKSAYEIKRNWQGDPCVPQDYLWEGVSCSYENERPRIISLNLSSSGLTGEIPPSIFNLTMIQTMDLSNNNLTGSIPELFSQLSKLNTLNLEKNNLSGSIPGGLIERRKHGLSLSLCDNPNLSEQVSCKKKKHSINIIPIAGTIFGILILLSTVAAVLWGFKRKRKHEMIKNSIPNWSLESEGQQFTYSELVEITNNFASIIGTGGFGKVYHGTLRDEIEVAVKLLTSSSGSIEFQNEVKLLMRAHHRNLVSLIGYCYEGDTMALVFEYVTKGTLEQHISAAAENVLSWKERLQIAIDAARGLDYLHNGCKPPIVHRDLKTSNILLNERKQAKICDFGVSKVISKEGATHTRTDHIKGTFGYIDPEYFGTRTLNKKSDIYSFGIVLLELITSRPAIITDIEPDPVHIRQWVSPKFEKLEIESIVYSKLQGTYNISSARKAIEIAMACAAPTAIQRPDITVVCIKLKECLEIEVPLEITKMPEIEESDDSTSHSSGSVLMMSHIEIETERHSN